jgi:uncharacterized protein (TIGR03067 family)
VPLSELKGGIYSIGKGRIELKKDGKVAREFSYKLDPTKSPKHIDLIHNEKKLETGLGVYKLEGDKLTLCLPAFAKNKGRPTELVSKVKSGTLLMVFERVKK